MSQSTRVFWKFLFCALIFLSALLVVYAVFIDKVPNRPIPLGATKDDVYNTLGDPEIVLDHPLARVKYAGEAWCYGPKFDFSQILSFEDPFIIRIFDAHPGDMIIVFNSESEVSQITFGSED